jgi:hypothetical protein
MTASAEGSATVVLRPPRVPDFFIVGQTKSGTTALCEMLKRHPQIYMPNAKDTLFLASDLRARFRPSKSDAFPETLDAYLSLFSAARPEQRVGEATAAYLWSRSAAGRIADLQPSARIIAIFREPASFLRSLHLQMLQNHIETKKDLRRAISLEDARRRGKRIPRRCPRPPALLYSDRVRYVEQLRRYHDVFPQEQVLVLIYDDFRSDNEGTVRKVLRFLEVDDTLPIETMEANPTVRPRSQQLHLIARTVTGGRGPVSRGVRAGALKLTSSRLRRRLVFGELDPPDEDLMLELRRRFKEEVVAFSEYLGRDLVTLWDYDSIG